MVTVCTAVYVPEAGLIVGIAADVWIVYIALPIALVE
jgi:hypothetical protein